MTHRRRAVNRLTTATPNRGRRIVLDGNNSPSEATLGNPANARLLILHADDFGMSHSVGSAIVEAALDANRSVDARRMDSGRVKWRLPRGLAEFP